MPRGRYAKPCNIEKGLRDLQGRKPHLKEVIECPVYQRTFDKFATIELMDEHMQGEIDFYCPLCEALVLREFRSPDRQRFEVVDPGHETGRK